MRPIAFVLTSLALAAACMRGPEVISIDSDATFVMHMEHREFLVDRPLYRPPEMVEPAEWLRTFDDPTWALRREGDTVAAYWLDGNAGTVARAGMQQSSHLLGAIRPSWKDNEIRLRIERPDAEPLQSDVFTRLTGGGGTPALSRNIQANIDIRGRYRASLRDATGKEVGWLGLRIGPYELAPRIFEGVLPAGLSPDIAVAAALSLNSEIDWIEAHTLNVYQGNTGQLMQSFPMNK